MIIALVLMAVLQVPDLPGMLLERRLAEALPAGVGDTVWVAATVEAGSAREFVVEGVFERAADPSRISRNEYEVRLHLPDLEVLASTRDRVDRFAVALRPEGDAETVGRWVESLAFGTQVFGTETLADEASTTFRVISRFHDAIGVVTLAASGIFLLCLMVIRVDQRRRDVRTMRLVGISGRTVLKVVMLEAVVVAAVASALGAVMGVVLSAMVNGYYSTFYDTTLRFAIVTPRIVLVAVGLGVLLGAGAGVLAALRVSRVPPQRLGER